MLKHPSTSVFAGQKPSSLEWNSTKNPCHPEAQQGVVDVCNRSIWRFRQRRNLVLNEISKNSQIPHFGRD
jgi:hypothetical protein